MPYDYPGNNQFPVSLTLPDDSDTPGQTTFSPGWEGNRDAVVYLLHRTGASPLYNFNPASVATASYAWTALDWDGQQVSGGGISVTLYARWIATQQDAGAANCRFQMCLDGRNWILSGGTATTGAVCLANSLTVSANIAANFLSNSKVVHATLTSGVTVITSSAGWNATQGCAWDNRTTGKAYFLGATQSGATFTGAAASYNYSATIVDLSANLPTNWVSGTNHVGNYRYATDGTTYVVLMCGVTPTTDTARLLNAAVIATPTDITPSVLANKIGVGIAYDTLSALWVLCAADGSNTYFYTSPDLIAWTLQATNGSETYTHTKEFAVISGAWVLVVNDYQGESTTSAVYISSSNGIQWNRAQCIVQNTTPFFAAGEMSMVFGDITSNGIAVSNAMSMA